MRYRRFILLISVVVSSCAILAQPRLRRPEVYVGAHAGVLASTVLFQPSIQGMELPNILLAPNGGLVFRYAGHKVCAIQVELNYMQRGWKEVLENVDYTRRLDYIEIPLLMHIYLGGEHVRGFFNLGPQIGYCFRETSTGIKNSQLTHQYADIQKPFDWGLAGGLGIYYRHKKVGLFQLEARCNYSFGAVFNNRTIDHFKFANSMNVSLNLAYMWQIKIK